MNQRQAVVEISNRSPFKSSALSASTRQPYGSGWLNHQELMQLEADHADIDYTVYSYATPIAWHTPRGWHVVAQRFSVTTSKHQSKVRQAVR